MAGETHQVDDMQDGSGMAPSSSLETLLAEVRACTLCAGEMRRPPRPVLQASASARILVAGQAPGNLAALSGLPFTDPSGDRLRDWMGIGKAVFYDAARVAVVPMGFCFPGNDEAGGDLPPMKRCAATWREAVLSQLPEIRLTLLVGNHAHAWHLAKRRARTLTDTVRAWRDYAGEGTFALPHPSWRNSGWLKRNPWFEAETLPALRSAVSQALASSP